MHSPKLACSRTSRRHLPQTEAYHQDYPNHHPDNPYITINDLPKLAAPKKEFPELYRENSLSSE